MVLVTISCLALYGNMLENVTMRFVSLTAVFWANISDTVLQIQINCLCFYENKTTAQFLNCYWSTFETGHTFILFYFWCTDHTFLFALKGISLSLSLMHWPYIFVCVKRNLSLSNNAIFDGWLGFICLHSRK